MTDAELRAKRRFDAFFVFETMPWPPDVKTLDKPGTVCA